MDRLTIEQIIEHCEKTTKQYEEKVSDLFPVERIQSKTYWEHKQVAEYLKELQRYKDLEELGRLIELPDCEAKELLINIVANEVNVCPVDMGFEQEGNCNDGCYACWKKYL